MADKNGKVKKDKTEKAANMKSAVKNAASTTGKQGIRKNKQNAYEYKAKESKHPLFKLFVAGYALRNTINYHKIDKLNEQRYELDINRQLAGPNQGSLQQYLALYKQMDIERRLKKCMQRQKRAEQVGHFIGTAVNMARESGRTLAMRHAVSSSYGATNGINRDDVTRTAATVAMASMDDGQIEF